MTINIEFSPDSSHILTASQDGRARVFDLNAKSLKFEPIEYGFFFNSPMAFSPDGKLFAISTSIGSDALSPIICDLETGEKLYKLSHFSGVMDILFTSDSNYLITGSRDKTAKIWDTSTGGNLTTLDVDDWVMGVGVDPRNTDQVFTFSRDRAIYAFSLKTGRYIDGPFQQPLIGDFLRSKIKTNPNLDYLVNIYSENSISLWPIGNKTGVTNKDRVNLEKYATTLSRVYQDQTGALKIIQHDDPSADDSFEFETEELNEWFRWREKGYRTQMHPKSGLSKDWYVDFLISQNTKDSLEQALVLRPSDLGIVHQYADKLESLSRTYPEGASKFKERAVWYRQKSQSADSSGN